MPRLHCDSDASRVLAGPVRTCVGCGERAARGDLLRVVATEGSVQADPQRRLPGRGAWIHPDPACLGRARQRRAFVRALRLSHDVGERVWEELGSAVTTAAPRVPTDE